MNASRNGSSAASVLVVNEDVESHSDNLGRKPRRDVGWSVLKMLGAASLILLYVRFSTCHAALVSAKSEGRGSISEKEVNRGVGWSVVQMRGAVPVFRVDPGYSYDLDLFRRSRGGQNLPVTAGSACASAPSMASPAKARATGPATEPARVMMLKLATTGSTWIGNLLEEVDAFFKLALSNPCLFFPR